MRILDLIWLIFLIPFIIPRLVQFFQKRKRILSIKRLEKKRDSKVITLVHRRSGSPFLDMLIGKFINTSDSDRIRKILREVPEDKTIDLLLHTPGGMVLAAKQIALALCRHKGEVNVYVPYYAMSGGTYLLLAADKVHMQRNANLGPINPQIGSFPAISIREVLDKKEPKDIDDTTLILGDVSKKALKQVENSAKEILRESDYSQEDAKSIVEELTSPDYTHDRMISYSVAEKMGLRVDDEIPSPFYSLMDLYSKRGESLGSIESTV